MAAPKNFTETMSCGTAHLVCSQKAFGKTVDERSLTVRLKGKKNVVFSWSMSGKPFGLDWAVEVKDGGKAKCYEFGADLQEGWVESLSEKLSQEELVVVQECVRATIEKWPTLAKKL